MSSAGYVLDASALLAALNEGVFDTLPVSVVSGVRAHLPSYLDANAKEEVAGIARTGKLEDATRTRLVELVKSLAGDLASREAGA